MSQPKPGKTAAPASWDAGWVLTRCVAYQVLELLPAELLPRVTSLQPPESVFLSEVPSLAYLYRTNGLQAHEIDEKLGAVVGQASAEQLGSLLRSCSPRLDLLALPESALPAELSLSGLTIHGKAISHAESARLGPTASLAEQGWFFGTRCRRPRSPRRCTWRI